MEFFQERYSVVNRFKNIAFIVSFLLPTMLRAQLGGIIVDSQTNAPISATQIFVNRTTLGTTSDEGGKFQLSNISPGLTEIVIYKNGYALYRSFIKINPSRAYNLKIPLTKGQGQRGSALSAPEISSLMQMITKGSGDVVPSVLNITDVEVVRGSDVVFQCKSPLEIRNSDTGYSIRYFIDGLHPDDLAHAPAKFDVLPYTTIKAGVARERSRQKYFAGSIRHWLISLAAGKTTEAGYSFSDANGKAVDVGTLVSPSAIATYTKFESKSALIVRHGSSTSSKVETTEPADFSQEGILINTKTIKIEGAMTNTGLGNLLPNDYKPIDGNVEDVFADALNKLYEKVYLHTDKPYYYAGERIWFKAYMNYYDLSVRDSLSRTLYIELLNPAKVIVMAKTLRLDSGLASNNFDLPDTLRHGDYYLRAYTLHQRNFGDENLFMKPIPLLSAKSKPVYVMEKDEQRDKSLAVASDKPVYGRRGAVALTLTLTDESAKPMAGHFSISVTDASQVVNIPPWGTISSKFPITKNETGKIYDLVFPIQKGVDLQGQFLNGKGKPEKTTLNVVRIQPYEAMIVDTDERGSFHVPDLVVPDGARFSIKATKGNQLSSGKVKLTPRETPVIKSLPQYSITLVDAQNVQRILSEYEKPDDARMLEEITITGKKEDLPENIVAAARPYGRGEYFFDESKIKTQFPNLLYTLQALNIAGMVVNPQDNAVYFSRHSKPVLTKVESPEPGAMENVEKSYTPMVTLDNMPMIGAAGDILRSIDPNTVGALEITKSASTIRGTLAPYGVIAVYTKSGASKPSREVTGVDYFKVPGYAAPTQFTHPAYEIAQEEKKIDYRSTLYWNPSVKASAATGRATVYFYTSDLAGSYRVEIEGINAHGLPVRSVSYIEVKE